MWWNWQDIKLFNLLGGSCQRQLVSKSHFGHQIHRAADGFLVPVQLSRKRCNRKYSSLDPGTLISFRRQIHSQEELHSEKQKWNSKFQNKIFMEIAS